MTTHPGQTDQQRYQRRRNGALLGFAGLVALLFVIGAVNSDGGGTSASGDEYAARDVCEQFVEDRLVSPSSADFSRPDVTSSGDKWTVRGQVDADNRMGAAIRVDYECVVRHTGGDSYRLVNLDHTER